MTEKVNKAIKYFKVYYNDTTGKSSQIVKHGLIYIINSNNIIVSIVCRSCKLNATAMITEVLSTAINVHGYASSK